jgi:adenylylsulfate kinase
VSHNTFLHNFKITKENREDLKGHKTFLIWFTGLSGSGKSTLANLVEIALYKKGISTYILDGDNIRQGINNDLSFSPDDRSENIRRIAEISKLMLDAGILTLATFVSPYVKDRQRVKKTVGATNFIEIYINTSIEECEKRDVKGLYKKARNGEIKNMTGISSPYEAPKNPDLEVVTDDHSIEESVNLILDFLFKKINLTYE